MRLTDEQLETLRLACGGRIGVVDWAGHQIVFRRPSRLEVREYRRKQDGAERPDALDQLAQAMLVALDGDADTTRARVAFTSQFLDQFPAFTSSGKFMQIATSSPASSSRRTRRPWEKA